MLPLAYAVVEVENKETWNWFLDLLIGDLGGPELCCTYTFISDQQKVSFLTFFSHFSDSHSTAILLIMHYFTLL